MLQTFHVPTLGRQINARGNFLRYESVGVPSLDEAVRVRVDGNDLGNYLPGDSIELPAAGGTWEITPVSAAQTCVVRIGVGRVDSARLVGTVQVIDGGRARTLAIQAGIGTARALASAGQFSITQLWNPLTSARRILVSKLLLASATSGLLLVRAENVQQTTLDGTPYSKKNQDNLGGIGFQTRIGNAGVTPGVPAFNVLVVANQSLIYELREPIAIDPGFGLSVASGAFNQEVFSSFEFAHEAI